MYTIYYDTSGKIEGWSMGCMSLNTTINKMTTAEPITSAELEWVNPATGLIEHRPQFTISCDKQTILANGQDEASLTNIPENTQCWYDGETHTITGGKLEFLTSDAGEYSLQFSLFPYIDMTIHISAKVEQSA